MADKFIEIEEWRWIDGFQNYEVSSLGRVRTRRMMKPNYTNGYEYVSLSKDKKQYRILVHRLVAETFLGPCPEGMECCHLNGDRMDNRVENLEWNTHQKNIGDVVKHRKEVIADNKKMKEALLLIQEFPEKAVDIAQLALKNDPPP